MRREDSAGCTINEGDHQEGQQEESWIEQEGQHEYAAGAIEQRPMEREYVAHIGLRVEA